MASVEVNMSDVSKSLFIDLRVKGVASFRIRTWMAVQLIKLAAFIMPANVSVNIEEPQA